MKKGIKNKPKKKLTKKEVAKLVKSASRLQKLPPNKIEKSGKTYKRIKKIDEE